MLGLVDCRSGRLTARMRWATVDATEVTCRMVRKDVAVRRRRRGPTRRLKRVLRAAPAPHDLLAHFGQGALAGLLPKGTSTATLLEEARHQADLLRDPYVDERHLCLAAARHAGSVERYEALRWQLVWPAPSTSGRWRRWRPRGLRSAARPAGQRELDRAQREALDCEAERNVGGSPGTQGSTSGSGPIWPLGSADDPFSSPEPTAGKLVGCVK